MLSPFAALVQNSVPPDKPANRSHGAHAMPERRDGLGFIPGWKAAQVLNDYFAGWEVVHPMATDEEFDSAFDELVGFDRKTTEIACQTPAEWLTSGPAQEAKEVKRCRAEPRDRTLSIGTTTPLAQNCPALDLLQPLAFNSPCTGAALCAGPETAKVPKAAAIHWCAPGKADAGMAEILFEALMSCVCYDGRVKELDQWARAAVREAPRAEELRSAWKPSDEWGKSNRYQVYEIFEPLNHAHQRCCVERAPAGKRRK